VFFEEYWMEIKRFYNKKYILSVIRKIEYYIDKLKWCKILCRIKWIKFEYIKGISNFAFNNEYIFK